MKKICLVIAALLLSVSLSWAGGSVNTETISVLTSATNTFTAAKIKDDTKQIQYAQRAFCTLTGGQLNFTYDGATTPTTTATGVGHYIASGSQLVITGYTSIRDFKAIAATGTVALTCSYEFVNE